MAAPQHTVLMMLPSHPQVLDEEEDARRKKAEKKAAKKKHPGKPLQPVQHVTDPKDVLRQSAKGNALEGIGFLDGLILQGTIYLILLLVGYFAVICTGDSCPDTTGRRFLVAGFIVIPCIVLLAAIVSIAASYQVSKSDMVYINRFWPTSARHLQQEQMHTTSATISHGHHEAACVVLCPPLPEMLRSLLWLFLSYFLLTQLHLQIFITTPLSP